MTAAWPWRGDTATDRARRIANTLLGLLDPAERARVITAARAVGETWLGAEMMRWADDDVITTAEAAQLVHVSPAMVRKWHSQGRLPRAGVEPGRYRVADVLECARRVRVKRARA